MDVLLSSFQRRELIAVYSDTKKKTLWTYYFSFFPLSVGFLVEFICQTSEKTKFESKDAKNEKNSIFQNLDLLHF